MFNYMRVIEEHRNDLKPPKSRIYIYKCNCCGSILEVEDEDISYDECWGDTDEYFICPVCRRVRTVFPIKFHHLKSLRKLFNKKYR